MRLHGGSMSGFLRSLFARRDSFRQQILEINALRAELAQRSDAELRSYARSTSRRSEVMAAAAVAAARVLGQEMFDVQLRGALALTEGRMPRCRPEKARLSRLCRP